MGAVEGLWPVYSRRPQEPYLVGVTTDEKCMYGALVLTMPMESNMLRYALYTASKPGSLCSAMYLSAAPGVGLPPNKTEGSTMLGPAS